MTSALAAAAVVVAALVQSAQTGTPSAPGGPPPDPPPAGRAVTIDGHLGVQLDAVPKQDAVELRPEIALDASDRPTDWLRYRLELLIQALVADRSGGTTDALARVQDGWIEVGGEHGDLRAGYGRVVWGRLDEIQPSDVINPLDTTRFLLDGRSAARLPVTFLRGRLMPSERLTLEGVVVPVFRRGTFDALDEPTSPFNPLRDVVLPATLSVAAPDIERITPAVTWSNLSGGGRVSATVGRVDVAGAIYRGFEGFGIVTFEPMFPAPPVLPAAGTVVPAVVGRLVERFPRFTMISGDFEAIAGEWAIRGELAAFVEKQFAGVTRPGPVDGEALDGGVGFDRRTGDYRVFGSVLVRREWSAADPGVARTDVSLVGSIDRTFARDRYLARAFAVVNPGDGSGFVRGLLVWTARDNVAVEASAGAFVGTGDNTLSRFHGRDFLFARLRYSF
jgi:hypothetical protein